jgi:hypothetical protein
MATLSAKLYLINDQTGGISDQFPLIDFNFGASFDDLAGKDFDGARLQDFIVAKTVLRLIIGQGTMIFAKYTDEVTVRIMQAFANKKMFKHGIVAVDEMADSTSAPGDPSSRPAGSRRNAQFNFYDMTITSVAPRIKTDPKFGIPKALDVVTVTMGSTSQMP